MIDFDVQRTEDSLPRRVQISKGLNFLLLLPFLPRFEKWKAWNENEGEGETYNDKICTQDNENQNRNKVVN